MPCYVINAVLGAENKKGVEIDTSKQKVIIIYDNIFATAGTNLYTLILLKCNISLLEYILVHLFAVL